MLQRQTLSKIAKAIFTLDSASYDIPSNGKDRQEVKQARDKLFAIVERNGYCFASPNSPRLRRMKHNEVL